MISNALFWPGLLLPDWEVGADRVDVVVAEAVRTTAARYAVRAWQVSDAARRGWWGVDARQLEYFLAIVDHDGFGRAAAQPHVAQPSLSQAIANLERELGVVLFHRIGRGVVLSAAGGELVEPARQVLRDLRTARATVESVKQVRRGRVELVTMPSPGRRSRPPRSSTRSGRGSASWGWWGRRHR